MACCHSITYIGEELIGDPLDIKMFESTKWNLYEQGNTNSMIGGNDLVLATVTPNNKKNHVVRNDEESDFEDSYKSEQQNDIIERSKLVMDPFELQIIKRFDFESKLMRMSVLVKHPILKTYKTFVKGSPEKIEELCKKGTLPNDYYSTLEQYTRKGYRVIALAYR